MDEQPIKDNPSLKKIRNDARNFTALKKAWPLLRPLLKMMGAKVEKVDEAMKQVDDLAKQSDKLTSIPDDFNSLFASMGWIMYDRMNMDLAKRAVQLGKLGNLDEAERVLIEYYSPEKIEGELRTMIAVEAFRSRMPLAEKALADFREGRY